MWGCRWGQSWDTGFHGKTWGTEVWETLHLWGSKLRRWGHFSKRTARTKVMDMRMPTRSGTYKQIPLAGTAGGGDRASATADLVMTECWVRSVDFIWKEEFSVQSDSVILFFLILFAYLFLATLGLCCYAWVFSSCRARASHYGGCSCCGAQAVGFGSCGSRT